MAWLVVASPEFAAWFQAESVEVQNRIAASLRALEEFGPGLGRPYVDTLKGSRVANLKELRVSVTGAPYRILFAFDPARQAVLLCGGDKAGDRRFYDRMIPLAEAILARHIHNLRLDEGDAHGDGE